MMVENEFNPPVVFHPGEMLQEKLEEINMQINEFALRCGKPEKTIHAILKGNSRITPDMALAFEQVLDIPVKMWLGWQTFYDEFLARQKQMNRLEEAQQWAANFPVNEMIKKGFLPQIPKETKCDKVNIMLRYFGIADHDAWSNYYQKQVLASVFRLSLSGVNNKYSLSAWLRYGELEAGKRNFKDCYTHDKLRQHLDDFVYLANNYREDFKEELCKLCEEVGILLVFTPHIANSKAHGATRWIKSTPLIQISDCRKHYDIFWFSFFHELGHILLHGKKDIFIDGISELKGEKDKEAEADEFASNKLVPREIVKQLNKNRDKFSDSWILEISKTENIHPAFLIGRMHHLGLLPHNIGNKFIPQVSFT